jgi:hypothetical protein
VDLFFYREPEEAEKPAAEEAAAEFGAEYGGALPAPAAADQWAAPPPAAAGADGFGAAPGFEAATGAFVLLYYRFALMVIGMRHDCKLSCGGFCAAPGFRMPLVSVTHIS